MDSAPTIPRDRAILLPITVITVPVRMVIVTKDTLNFLLYAVPVWVYQYDR